ncbi:MAG: hypothetical protein [Inoviridae sp.]|nr:MAG: hypothetical protein [Inoviridae sp.]
MLFRNNHISHIRTYLFCIIEPERKFFYSSRVIERINFVRIEGKCDEPVPGIGTGQAVDRVDRASHTGSQRTLFLSFILFFIKHSRCFLLFTCKGIQPDISLIRYALIKIFLFILIPHGIKRIFVFRAEVIRLIMVSNNGIIDPHLPTVGKLEKLNVIQDIYPTKLSIF